jgi:transposase
MIRKDKIKFSDGSFKTQIRVVRGVRPGPGLAPKQVTIKSFGYLEDQTDTISFMKQVELFNESIIKNTKNKKVVIDIPLDLKNNDAFNRKFNYGYRFLESILDKLEIDSFFNQVDFKGDYSLSEIFSFLVYRRIMNPCSKRATLQEINHFYNKNYSFSLADTYRALDKFSDISIKLQTHLNDKVKKIVGRDSTYAFYDVTNYYFEKDFNSSLGEYQQKGVSKEHRLEPIVQLGLFMDSNNLPIAMSVFPGNTSDSITLQPAMREIKSSYNLGRLIVVADKGLNSTNNIDYIVNNGDGYVVSQVLRGPKGKRYHEILFENEGYIGDENHKYKLLEEEYTSNINSKKTVTRKRKVLIYYSKDEAERTKRKRDEKIAKATKALKNNAYSISHKASEYITTTHVLSTTGEVSDQAVIKIDIDKVLEEAKLDGYFCIITSELEYDYKKIIEVYSSLWRIEESFKITKSDLKTRPIFVRTKKHIEGHMLVCFTALLVLRLLQFKLKDKEISVKRIKRVLNSSNCTLPNEAVVMLDQIGGMMSFTESKNKKGELVESLQLDEENDTIRNDWLMLQRTFGIDFDYAATSREAFNKYIKSIVYKVDKKK